MFTLPYEQRRPNAIHICLHFMQCHHTRWPVNFEIYVIDLLELHYMRPAHRLDMYVVHMPTTGDNTSTIHILVQCEFTQIIARNGTSPSSPLDTTTEIQCSSRSHQTENR